MRSSASRPFDLRAISRVEAIRSSSFITVTAAVESIIPLLYHRGFRASPSLRPASARCRIRWSAVCRETARSAPLFGVLGEPFDSLERTESGARDFLSRKICSALIGQIYIEATARPGTSWPDIARDPTCPGDPGTPRGGCSATALVELTPGIFAATI